MTPNPGVKLRTTAEERAKFPFCSIPRCDHRHSVESRLAADIEALLAENTRLRALLVAEKREHADLLDAADMVSGFTCGEGSRPLRASADAIERGEG